MVEFYIDSNVFFYARIMDRSYGRSCANVVRRVASKQLDASTSVLVPIEVANAMSKYGLAKDVPTEIHAIVSLGLEIYPIEAADASEAAEFFRETGVSPYDCLHASVIRKNGLKDIVSADKDFDKFQWLRRTDPRSIPGTPH